MGKKQREKPHRLVETIAMRTPHGIAFPFDVSGTLQVDGYTGHNALIKPGRNSGPVRLAYCWARARRKLKEVHDRDRSPITNRQSQVNG